MCRLAPVQLTSWGTHGTSGLNQIDYYLSWSKAEIPTAQTHYTETLVPLDSCPLFASIPRIPPPASRRELDLPEQGAIYFCPHRSSKYHPRFDGYLRDILERDRSGHVVLLMGKPSQLMKRLIDRMKSAIGPELFRRIIIVPQLDVSRYYRYLSASTVLLNSPIYSGEITAVDGFLYGAPCVSETGDLLIQRYASAYYEEFGITGPVGAGKEHYVAQSVRLGTDQDYRRKISEEIFAHKTSFFENRQVVECWTRLMEKTFSL